MRYAQGIVGVSVSENTRSVVEGESRSPEKPNEHDNESARALLRGAAQ